MNWVTTRRPQVNPLTTLQIHQLSLASHPTGRANLHAHPRIAIAQQDFLPSPAHLFRRACLIDNHHKCHSGASQPPQTLVAILIAVQMCKHVDIYGFDSVSAAPSKGLSYYSKDPAGLTVHDISTTRPEAIETMAAGVDNAIVELLEVVGHVKLVRNL